MSDQHDMEAAQEHAAEQLTIDTMQTTAVSDILDALLPFSQDNILNGCALFASDVHETAEELDEFLKQWDQLVREFWKHKKPLQDEA